MKVVFSKSSDFTEHFYILPFFISHIVFKLLAFEVRLQNTFFSTNSVQKATFRVSGINSKCFIMIIFFQLMLIVYKIMIIKFINHDSIFDKKKSIVCCLHSGWKGALNNIVSKGIKKIKRKKIKSQNIIVIVGPCLGFNNFEVDTDNVDNEISNISGPQLVVPITNARYALNAVNARWGSLYDAIYGTDILGELPNSPKYDHKRGEEVITYSKKHLDIIAPLIKANWNEIIKIGVENNNYYKKSANY